jgi:AcrR family transcriptional regulator
MNQGEPGDGSQNARPIAVFSIKRRGRLPGFAPSPRGYQDTRRPLETDHSVSWIAIFGRGRYFVDMSSVAPIESDSAELDARAPPRERLIETARILFCRYGINSVGVDAIVDAAGTAKTTLYKLFGSKDGLVEAVLEREGSMWRTWFLGAIDGPGGSARERLDRIGPALKVWFSRDDFYGCAFINAVGESDKADDRMRSLAIAHKKIVLERLSALCAEDGDPEPEQAAHTLGLIIDGAIVMALITRDPSAAEVASRACAALMRR